MVSIQRLLSLLAITACAAAIGCQSLARPNIHHPGDSKTQQGRAAVWDPFPDNDGGPEVEGGRPPTYSTPPPDWQRSQYFREHWSRTVQ